MTIEQAIEQIIGAVRAASLKDENGINLVPPSSQRPLLLYGPPGVGKTFAVRQAADTLGIAFLSYTMTHHTRQSALGLPRIVTRTFNGNEYSVTEYTVSEIMRDVYEAAARENGKRGILFLDEINCVSETLMPAILEMLQFKRFGHQDLPEGWVIVCAGNPEVYNRSARSFDPVTMDRVRLLRIEPDSDTWLRYASARNTHPAILAYIRLKPEDLCVYGRDTAVTPRSWSDLSCAMRAAEALDDTPSPLLFEQYLQDPRVCNDFRLFFEMCTVRGNTLDINAILRGDRISAETFTVTSFDLKIYFASLLAERLGRLCAAYAAKADLSSRLTNFLNGITAVENDHADTCKQRLKQMEHALDIRRDAGAVREEGILRETVFFSRVRAAFSTPHPIETLKQEAADGVKNTAEEESALLLQLSHGITFADENFTESALRVVFVTAMRASATATAFLRSHPNDAWSRLCTSADTRTRSEELKQRLRENTQH